VSAVGWSHVIAAWAIVILLLALAVSGAALTPALGRDGSGFHGVIISRYDPFSAGQAAAYGQEKVDADLGPRRR
jgi:hypothetical protein